MSHVEVEKSGDFSVKELLFFFYNQRSNHEIGMVKNIRKGCSPASFVAYST